MIEFTNGKPCRLLSCPFTDPIHAETIYANWDLLIGIAGQGKSQYRHGLESGERPKKRAVFYNIYEGNDLALEWGNIKGEKKQRAAKSC